MDAQQSLSRKATTAIRDGITGMFMFRNRNFIKCTCSHLFNRCRLSLYLLGLFLTRMRRRSSMHCLFTGNLSLHFTLGLILVGPFRTCLMDQMSEFRQSSTRSVDSVPSFSIIRVSFAPSNAYYFKKSQLLTPSCLTGLCAPSC